MSELLPCPFCGSADIVRLEVRRDGNGIMAMDDDPPVYQVGCRECGGLVELDSSAADADKNWNRRAPIAQREGVTEEMVERAVHAYMDTQGLPGEHQWQYRNKAIRAAIVAAINTPPKESP